MYSQKTNWGTLAKIPEICVNRFGGMTEAADIDWTKSRAFFLTHCDPVTMSDVLNGYLLFLLQDSEFNSTQTLYMHEVSFKMLEYYSTSEYVVCGSRKRNWLKKLQAAGRIVFVQPNTIMRLRFKMQLPYLLDRVVDVIPLCAGSCPGSVMYLFEQINHLGLCIFRILYTGNCRLSLDDLRAMPSLYDTKSEKLKYFDIVYLDTSHFNPDTKELPSRRLAIDKALRLMDQRRAENNRPVRVDVITSYRVSDLIFIKEYFNKYSQKIHVEPFLGHLCKQEVIDMSRAITTDGGDKNYSHFNCSAADDCYTIKQVCKINLHCHVGLNESKIRYLQSSDTYHWNNLGAAAYKRKEMDVTCIYSPNLSRYEAIRMLNFLKVDVDKVKPLYIPNGMNLEELKDLMTTSLRGKPPAEPEDILHDFPGFRFDFTGCPLPARFYCSDSNCFCGKNLSSVYPVQKGQGKNLQGTRTSNQGKRSMDL